jgi:biotin carboxylase
VQIVRNEQELLEAVSHARRFATGNEDILVEEYLQGSKHTCEVIFAENECFLVSIIDTHYISERYPCELGLNTTELEDSLQLSLHEMTREIGLALGLNWGPFKADVNWDGEQFKLIECTARLSGGFHCQYATRAAFGTNEIRAVLKLAIGDGFDPGLVLGTRKRGAAVRAAFPAPGRITRIGVHCSDTETSPYLERVDRLVVTKREGDLLGPYRNSSDRGFFSLAQGQTVLEAVRNAEQGARHIEHNVETELFDECPHCGSKNVNNVRENIEEPLQFWCQSCGEQFHYFEARSVEMFDRTG